MAGDTHSPLLDRSEFRAFADLPNIEGLMYKPPDSYPKNHKWHYFAEPMVRCSDGGVRRFPQTNRVDDHYEHQVDKGLIYDVPAKYVTNHIGGIKMSEDKKSAAFEVSGHAVSPVLLAYNFKAYPLPNGRVLIPQPGINDCTHACKLMMMLDQGHLSLESAGHYETTAPGSRRTVSEVMEALERETGRTAMLVEHDISYKTSLLGAAHPSRKQAWLDLGAKINEMGPCILSKGGHVVMLDGVRESGGKVHLTIREPFHGSSLEFRDTAKFFTTHERTPEKVKIRAIFLKPQGAS